MKRLAILLSVFVVFFAANGVMAVDKAAISETVDAIVADIDAGKDVMEIKAAGYDPYVFIMEQEGKLLVHPTLSGKSLMDEAPPAYQALMAADPAGGWVEYEWQGKPKNTYAKKTKSNLIVGSGY